MKNRKVIVPASGLNQGVVIEVDSGFVASGFYDISNSIEVKTLYPNYLYIDNGTGTDLLWNTISNEREYEDYLKFPNQYALIPLKNSKVLQSLDKIPKCYKLLIQKNPSSSNATNNLEIYFINYN